MKPSNLVRFETPNGESVWVNPIHVHSVSAETETSTVIETGGYFLEVSGTVDETAKKLGEDIDKVDE